MSEAIINKVSESGLITVDLEAYYPTENIAIFDLKDYLFKGLILREKEFREALKDLDWNQYRDQVVGITCTADAIIPAWAYMLVASHLQSTARDIIMGDRAEVVRTLFLKNIRAINTEPYADQRVVVKGCGEKPIGDFAYAEITKVLRPVARTIMYGEPCSTVPIFKRKS